MLRTDKSSRDTPSIPSLVVNAYRPVDCIDSWRVRTTEHRFVIKHVTGQKKKKKSTDRRSYKRCRIHSGHLSHDDLYSRAVCARLHSQYTLMYIILVQYYYTIILIIIVNYHTTHVSVVIVTRRTTFPISRTINLLNYTARKGEGGERLRFEDVLSADTDLLIINS